MATLLCILFFVNVALAQTGISWTDHLPDGTVEYACAGETVTLHWKYTLNGTQSVDDVQWFYQGHSIEMIGVLTHGNFLPLPSFARRVHFLQNAGIRLSNVTVHDTGNYSVEISGHYDSGSFFRIRRTVQLQIGADLMTTDGTLHVTVNPKSVMDSITGEWSVELHCGKFTYIGLPPFDVEWTTPSGHLLSSTSYNDGYYKLLVPYPVLGGNYTCRIPSNEISVACLSMGSGANKGEVDYNLDRGESRLAILEAHQKALQEENNVLKAENFRLKNSDANILNRVQAIENQMKQHVSFHARNLRNTSPTHDSPLIVETVISNQGNAYDPTTGLFTAPYNGTYFFIGTCGSWATGEDGEFELTVDERTISFVGTRDQGPLDAATVHGVTHLTSGNKVWLKVSSGIQFSSAATSFSGFLINIDV